MQKLKFFIFLLSLTSICRISAAEVANSYPMLTDENYMNIARIYWPSRDNWVVTEKLKNSIRNIDQSIEQCSKGMSYVPMPTGAPPGEIDLAKYFLNLHKSRSKIKNRERYQLCIKATAWEWRSPVEIDQNEQ
ncbi:MAG: hypothetical protein ACXWFF_18575 [Methylomonas sp.]